MAMPDYSYTHGAAIVQLVNRREYLSITKLPGSNQSEYRLNDNTALYIKHSSPRQESSTWTFTFSAQDQARIRRMYDRYGEHCFILLVCDPDGVCVLRFGEYASCLPQSHQNSEGLTVTRPTNRSFRVRGKLGELKHKIPLTDFPKVLFER